MAFAAAGTGTGKDRMPADPANAQPDDNAETSIFDGTSQVLDHMFVTEAQAEIAEFDIVRVNNDVTRDDNRIEITHGLPASDHEPVDARFRFGRIGRRWVAARHLWPFDRRRSRQRQESASSGR